MRAKQLEMSKLSDADLLDHLIALAEFRFDPEGQRDNREEFNLLIRELRIRLQTAKVTPLANCLGNTMVFQRGDGMVVDNHGKVLGKLEKDASGNLVITLVQP